MVCTKRAVPLYLNGREGYSECWANTELGLNWIVEMWKYARGGDKEMSSLWKQWNISACVTWWRTDLQRRAWPWRGSSPSSPGPPASGGTGSTTALTSVSTLSSLLTQMASRWTNICFTKILLFSARLVVTTNTSWRRRGGRSTWGPWRRRRTWSLRSTDSTRWAWWPITCWSHVV